MDAFTLFHFFLIFFLLGLGYAVVAVLLGQIGGGHEHAAGGGADGHGAAGDHAAHGAGAHADSHGAGADAGADPMPTLSPLSPVTVATFATAFGGSGMLLDRIGLPGFLSVPVAAGAGGLVGAAVFYLFYRVFRITQSTSGVSARQAIGRPAEVTVPIPENGVGEIAYVSGGRRFNSPARCENGRAAPARSGVVIVGREGAVLIVRASPTT